jgi:hypothetical protein
MRKRRHPIHLIADKASTIQNPASRVLIAIRTGCQWSVTLPATPQRSDYRLQTIGYRLPQNFFKLRAEEKLTAFLEPESAIYACGELA